MITIPLSVVEGIFRKDKKGSDTSANCGIKSYFTLNGASRALTC